MQITVDLSDRQINFLKWMVSSENKYERIDTLEDAVKECVNIAIFDEGETFAMQEGM
ncbi:MAG: hypothetical protein HQL08_08865 [Nitrospirae bacterium]|nr:hypothetical protein [Nitrospirota bacterium]